jgi:hypothetical protein
LAGNSSPWMGKGTCEVAVGTSPPPLPQVPCLAPSHHLSTLSTPPPPSASIGVPPHRGVAGGDEGRPLRTEAASRAGLQAGGVGAAWREQGGQGGNRAAVTTWDGNCLAVGALREPQERVRQGSCLDGALWQVTRQVLGTDTDRAWGPWAVLVVAAHTAHAGLQQCGLMYWHRHAWCTSTFTSSLTINTHTHLRPLNNTRHSPTPARSWR